MVDISTISGLLLSIFLLCKIIDIAWCVAMMFILLKLCVMAFSRILKFSFMIFIEGMCVVTLVLVMMTSSGYTFHHVLVNLSISG